MKLKEYDIYIFDFDGTLSDTIPGVKNSVKYALTFLGIDETDDKKLDYFIGPPLFESFTKLYNVDEKTANMLMRCKVGVLTISVMNKSQPYRRRSM